MISTQTFNTLITKGIRVKQCKKIKMKTKVYMLTLKWLYINHSITTDVLLVFQDLNVSVSIDSIKGQFYYTENFRREISSIVDGIIIDLSKIPEYRFHFFYKKIRLSVTPKYLIQNYTKYNKRIESKEYVQREANRLLREVNGEIAKLTLPPHQRTQVYFKKIILYGYDGVELSNELESLGVIKKSYTKNITFPNSVCEFCWDGIENPIHNREDELIRIWYRHLEENHYSCEIIFNE